MFCLIWTDLHLRGRGLSEKYRKNLDHSEKKGIVSVLFNFKHNYKIYIFLIILLQDRETP